MDTIGATFLCIFGLSTGFAVWEDNRGWFLFISDEVNNKAAYYPLLNPQVSLGNKENIPEACKLKPDPQCSENIFISAACNGSLECFLEIPDKQRMFLTEWQSDATLRISECSDVKGSLVRSNWNCLMVLTPPPCLPRLITATLTGNDMDINRAS